MKNRAYGKPRSLMPKNLVNVNFNGTNFDGRSELLVAQKRRGTR